jgi:hypothetical protein
MRPKIAGASRPATPLPRRAAPFRIRLRYEGLEGLRLDGDRLLLETSVGTLVEEAPYAYQRDAAGREVPVPCAFALKGGEIRFRLPEGWTLRANSSSTRCSSAPATPA